MEATRIRLEPSLAMPTAIEAAPGALATAPAPPPAPAPAPAPGRKGRGGRRLFRWLIGGAMLAEAAYLLAPSVLYRTSVRASVVAPLATVRIHQQGVVHGTPPEVGSGVSPGQVLFEVRAASPDLRPSDQARAEAESVRRAADALRAQLADLDALKATLRAHFDDYREARVGRAERLLAEQEALVDAARSRIKEAEFEHRVRARLSSKGASSDVELARAEYALELAHGELQVAEQAEARCRLQLDAARRGVFVGDADGGQDRVASLQRCDEIEIQQMGLRARLGELDGRRVELETRIESERRHLADGRLPVVSPIEGIVWSSALAPGVEVSPGTTALEVVEPGRLAVEAFFREADAERIRPGTEVEVRLVGSPRILRGRVARVTDPAATDPGTIGEVPRVAVPPGAFRALIALEDQPADGDPANRHHIGGPAIVRAAR